MILAWVGEGEGDSFCGEKVVDGGWMDGEAKTDVPRGWREG